MRTPFVFCFVSAAYRKAHVHRIPSINYAVNLLGWGIVSTFDPYNIAFIFNRAHLQYPTQPPLYFMDSFLGKQIPKCWCEGNKRNLFPENIWEGKNFFIYTYLWYKLWVFFLVLERKNSGWTSHFFTGSVERRCVLLIFFGAFVNIF